MAIEIMAPAVSSEASEKRLRGAAIYYQLRADRVLSFIDPMAVQEDHTLAYTHEILHTYLSQAFFEKDQEEGNPFELVYHFFGRRIWSDQLTPEEQLLLGECYAMVTEKAVGDSARNKNAGIQFSPKQEAEIQKVMELARSNARELVQVATSGEEVRPRLFIRVPVALNFLRSSVAQFLETVSQVPLLNRDQIR